jgi:hypothetical protein
MRSGRGGLAFTLRSAYRLEGREAYMKKPEGRACCSALRPLSVLERELVTAAPEERESVPVVTVVAVVVTTVVVEEPRPLAWATPAATDLGQLLLRQRLQPLPGHRQAVRLP